MEHKTVASTDDDNFMRVISYLKYSVIPLVVLNNATIAFVLLKNNHWRKRSSTVFMVMMAISDIFGAFTRNIDFLPGVYHCVLNSFANFLSIFPVWMQVCLVTERAIAVSCPIKSRLILTKLNAAITSAVLFICFVSISFLPIIDQMGYCSFDNKGNEYIPIVISIIYFVVPFLWTVICNSIIVWHLKRKNESRHSENAKNVANSVVRIALVFSITFFIFTAPISIFNVIFLAEYNKWEVVINAEHRSKDRVVQILQLVSQIFHATNIILYIVSSKTFRDDIIRSIRSILCCS